MKKCILFLILSGIFSITESQQTYTITPSGLAFNPSTVTVNQGDIVQFNVGIEHPVLQVSESTWNSNGNTPLSGGFSFPDGTGIYNANLPGTYYYICTNHINSGMKGKIIVNGSTGLEPADANVTFTILPNPANDYIIISNLNEPVQEIRILDITGKTIMNMSNLDPIKDQYHYDVSALYRGIYFISLKLGDQVITRKFIKL